MFSQLHTNGKPLAHDTGTEDRLRHGLVQNSTSPLTTFSAESFDRDLDKFWNSSGPSIGGFTESDAKHTLTASILTLQALHLSPSLFREDLEFWFDYATKSLDFCLNRDTYDSVLPLPCYVIFNHRLQLVGLDYILRQYCTAAYFKISYARVLCLTDPTDPCQSIAAEMLSYHEYARPCKRLVDKEWECATSGHNFCTT